MLTITPPRALRRYRLAGLRCRYEAPRTRADEAASRPSVERPVDNGRFVSVSSGHAQLSTCMGIVSLTFSESPLVLTFGVPRSQVLWRLLLDSYLSCRCSSSFVPLARRG